MYIINFTEVYKHSFTKSLILFQNLDQAHVLLSMVDSVHVLKNVNMISTAKGNRNAAQMDADILVLMQSQVL